MRVETKAPSTDSLVSGNHSAARSHAPVVFHGASVKGDSLFGVGSGSARPVAIADVHRAEQRRFSARRTAALAISVVTVSLFAFAAAVAASGAAAGLAY